jgi:hypothetical protein
LPRTDRTRFAQVQADALRAQLGAGANIIGGSKELARRRDEQQRRAA